MNISPNDWISLCEDSDSRSGLNHCKLQSERSMLAYDNKLNHLNSDSVYMYKAHQSAWERIGKLGLIEKYKKCFKFEKNLPCLCSLT